MLAERIGDAIALGHAAHGLKIVHEAEWNKIIRHPPDDSVMLLKSARGRISGSIGEAVENVLVVQMPHVLRPLLGHRQMPLADHAGAITGRLEHLRDGDSVAGEITAIAGAARVRRHAANAGLMRIKPAHETRSRRAASPAIVKLREPQPA